MIKSTSSKCCSIVVATAMGQHLFYYAKTPSA